MKFGLMGPAISEEKTFEHCGQRRKRQTTEHRCELKYKGLCEQPSYIRVVTMSCNMKLIIGIAWINLNHNNITALERSVINNSQ